VTKSREAKGKFSWENPASRMTSLKLRMPLLLLPAVLIDLMLVGFVLVAMQDTSQ